MVDQESNPSGVRPHDEGLQVQAQVEDLTYVSDGAVVALRAFRDGSPIVMPWVQALVLEGRVHQVTVGSLTTPVGDGTVMVLARPMLTVGAPAGISMIPLSVRISLLNQLLDTDGDECEAMISIDRISQITGGAATAEVIFNLRTDKTSSSQVLARSVYTADATPTPVLGIELAHLQRRGDIQGVAATSYWTEANLIYDPETKPIIVGPGTLLEHHGGTTAVLGFVSAVWAEFSSNILT